MKNSVGTQCTQMGTKAKTKTKKKQSPAIQMQNNSEVFKRQSDEKNFDIRLSAEKKSNFFSQFYPDDNKAKQKKQEGNDIQKALKKYTHSDALRFAATSYSWGLDSTRKTLPRRRLLDLPTFSCETGVRAYYRVIAEKSDKYVLLACHVNVHGLHRSDLRFVEVNDRTVLKGFEKHSVIGNLFLGDVLAVKELARVSNGPMNLPSIKNVHQESKCTWEVKNMTLLSRTMIEDVVFACLPNKMAVVKGYDEPLTVKRRKSDKLKTDTMYHGNAFIPEKMLFNFTQDVVPAKRNQVLAKSSKIGSYPNAAGTIHGFVLSSEKSEILNIGVDAFRADSPATKYEKEEIVETCALMGYSAVNSVFNGRFDCRSFPMLNARKDGHIIRFSIPNPTKQPTEGVWKNNTRINIQGKCGEIRAVVETVLSEKGCGQLNLVARISRDSPKDINFKDNVYIVSQKESLAGRVLKDGFFERLPSNCNARRVIETLYGAQPMQMLNPTKSEKFVYPGTPYVTLNDYQNEYVSMILARLPIAIASSPFGCGKSMTIVTAALEVFKRLGKSHQQLLVTQSNYASVNLAEIASKVQFTKAKFVRFVSEANWKTLPDNCRTDYDMPKLMDEVFLRWATGTETKSVSHWHAGLLARYVVEKKLAQPNQLVGVAENAYRARREKDSGVCKKMLVEPFFALYEPNIILTTADSLQGLVQYRVLRSVRTVQIDEASQVPEYTILGLLTLYPHASFGLIGDVKQLPPYCEDELDGKLKEFGIGNTMERAVSERLFPMATLRLVYRCHPATTRLLSELFYEGELISGVEEDQRNEFMTKRKDVWPNSQFPIMILDNKSAAVKMGTSSSNPVEKELVKQLIGKLTKPYNGYQLKTSDIGVISFYAAQTNILTEALRGSGVKCGTVDAFQGSEREVVVLCCTNERLSEFMQLPNRLNVALSRARQATIIVGNVEMLKKAKYWSRIVEKAEKKGCVVDTNKLPFKVNSIPAKKPKNKKKKTVSDDLAKQMKNLNISKK